jgi:hypothetical protein
MFAGSFDGKFGLASKEVLKIPLLARGNDNRVGVRDGCEA